MPTRPHIDIRNTDRVADAQADDFQIKIIRISCHMLSSQNGNEKLLTKTSAMRFVSSDIRLFIA